MKTFKFLLSAFLITTLFTFNQCKKDKITEPAPDNPYGLPNATQTGANIFACRVNGVSWISKTDIYNLGASISNDTLNLGGGGGGLLMNGLGFSIKQIQQGQSYLLNTTIYPSGNVFITNAINSCVSGTLNARTISGTLILTIYDLTNKIVSGKFSCTIPIPQCDTLKITDGRFDIKYN